MSTQRHSILFLLCAVFILDTACAFAADDGLGFKKKIESQYVTVYASSGWDPAALAQQLNIRPSDEILAGRSLEPKNSREEALAQMLDTLFIQVSNILDMHLYSLKTDIKICKTTAELSDIYNRLFTANLGGRRSFYVYDFNSIYVSAEAFQSGIIGHEMSHAIMNHYFVVAAPVKVQEVLAMYVEYSLKK